MKKYLALSAALLLAANTAAAGEYMPYIGFDYVNMDPNVKGVYPQSYNIGNLNAGIKFSHIGSIEAFAERSMREKDNVNGITSRGRLYGYGVDLLGSLYDFNEASILASVGYARMSTKLKYNQHTSKDDGNLLRLGLGGEINPTPEWGFRAMFRYSLADSDAFKNSKEFGIGARYYFY